MEFYNSCKHKSRKIRFCELCGHVINAGDYYYSERRKYNGEFFSRDLHTHCYNMESEFCCEVNNEFAWYEITDYIRENYCRDCKHYPYNYQNEKWGECDYAVTECPKLIKRFSDKED